MMCANMFRKSEAVVKRCVWDRTGSFGIVRDRTGSYGIVRDRSGSFRDCLGSFGIVWDRLGSFAFPCFDRQERTVACRRAPLRVAAKRAKRWLETKACAQQFIKKSLMKNMRLNRRVRSGPFRSVLGPAGSVWVRFGSLRVRSGPFGTAAAPFARCRPGGNSFLGPVQCVPFCSRGSAGVRCRDGCRPARKAACQGRILSCMRGPCPIFWRGISCRSDDPHVRPADNSSGFSLRDGRCGA